MMVVVMTVTVVMVVMMVMVVPCVAFVIDVAMLRAAVLALGFQLQRGVPDAVLAKLLADFFLDLVTVAARNDVHCGIVALSVHTPDVDVVNVEDALDVRQVLADLLHVDAVGRFFQEQIEHLPKIFDGVDKNKDRYADRKDRIKQRKIGKAHHDGTNEDDNPAEHVLQHMQIDRALIQRPALAREHRRQEIDANADDREQDHSVVIDGGRGKNAIHRVPDHGGRS